MNELFKTEEKNGICTLISYMGNEENIVLPTGIDVIGEGAFRNCQTAVSVTLPHGVRRIASFAFENCSRLRLVVVPESVTSLGANLFMGITRSFEIRYAGGLKDFEKMATFVVDRQSYTDGDYHHSTATRFTPTERVITTYKSAFGTRLDAPYICMVTCARDSAVLNVKSVSPSPFQKTEIIRY